MFETHQPVISAYARAGPDGLARVLQFCVMSARERFYNVPALMEEAQAGDPSALFAWKARAYNEIWLERRAIYWNCQDIWTGGAPERARANALLAYLSTLYGLGSVKAGFACSLAYGVSGCVDTVNAARFGLDPARGVLRSGRHRTPKGRARRASQYNALVRRLGGTAVLWDTWCGAIAARYPARFETPHAASAWHLDCLELEE